MKQTAVEWLVEQVFGKHTYLWNDVIDKAKAMEREQMIRFAEDYEQYVYNKSQNNRYVSPKTPDQYYNETYGGEQ